MLLIGDTVIQVEDLHYSIFIHAGIIILHLATWFNYLKRNR